mmetsp:Transcript_33751/g.84702  ORF Transcript_33751/g.84702 Transcript_33751/m.84702 type:complete len:293 (+) Transcript_33751:821-1699(+)
MHHQKPLRGVVGVVLPRCEWHCGHGEGLSLRGAAQAQGGVVHVTGGQTKVAQVELELEGSRSALGRDEAQLQLARTFVGLQRILHREAEVVISVVQVEERRRLLVQRELERRGRCARSRGSEHVLREEVHQEGRERLRCGAGWNSSGHRTTEHTAQSDTHIKRVGNVAHQSDANVGGTGAGHEAHTAVRVDGVTLIHGVVHHVHTVRHLEVVGITTGTGANRLPLLELVQRHGHLRSDAHLHQRIRAVELLLGVLHINVDQTGEQERNVVRLMILRHDVRGIRGAQVESGQR